MVMVKIMFCNLIRENRNKNARTLIQSNQQILPCYRLAQIKILQTKPEPKTSTTTAQMINPLSRKPNAIQYKVLITNLL